MAIDRPPGAGDAADVRDAAKAPGDGTRRLSSDALGIFTFLWAQVMLIQVVKLGLPLTRSPWPPRFEASFWTALQASACAVGVVLPHRAWTTVYLTLASLVVLWFTGSQSNHVVLDMAVCSAVLLSFSADRARWQAQAAHAIRSFLVALYFVTALHKLNVDWADPRRSCCTLMLAGVLALPPLQWLLPLVPWAAAPHLATLTELILPTLLLWGRWDRIAAVFGCLFHLVLCQMLSPMSVYPFSVLMVPLYVFVIPTRVAVVFDRVRPWVTPIVAFYAVLTRAWAGFMASGEEIFEYPAYGLWAPGVVWCTLANIALITAAMLPEPVEASKPAELARGRTWRGTLPALGVALLGLAPYVGVRDYPALAMFSNLRSGAGRSNHLFIADDFDFLGWQRDYVTVHETDVPALRLTQVDLGPKFTASTRKALLVAGVDDEFWITPPLEAWPYPETRAFVAYSMPFLELRRRVTALRAAGRAVGRVRYTRTVARARLALPWIWSSLGRQNPDHDLVRANLTYDLSAGGDLELEAPLPRWLATLARFRTFDVDYSPCRH